MYACIYVCARMYAYTVCMYILDLKCMYVCVYMLYIDIYLYCMYVCMYVYTYECIYAYTVYMYVYSRP